MIIRLYSEIFVEIHALFLEILRFEFVTLFVKHPVEAGCARAHVLKHPKMTHRHVLSVECLAVYKVSAQSVQPLCGYSG